MLDSALAENFDFPSSWCSTVPNYVVNGGYVMRRQLVVCSFVLFKCFGAV